MSQLTTHILDTTRGKPAQGIPIVLYRQQDKEWIEKAKGITNTEGRIVDFLSKDVLLDFGIYKLKFNTREYFDILAIETFYPYIEIVFEIKTNDHYHVPLLLNPFGFSTYRGS